MLEREKDVAAARTAAGHNALRIIEEFGIEEGGDLLRAVALTYLRAHAAVFGWPETMALVHQQCAEYFVPPVGQKLQLVVSNSAETVEVAFR